MYIKQMDIFILEEGDKHTGLEIEGGYLKVESGIHVIQGACKHLSSLQVMSGASLTIPECKSVESIFISGEGSFLSLEQCERVGQVTLATEKTSLSMPKADIKNFHIKTKVNVAHEVKGFENACKSILINNEWFALERKVE